MTSISMEEGLEARTLLARYRRAREGRRPWEPHWRECLDYTLPQRGAGHSGLGSGGEKRGQSLFDATAGDAAEQLAASLLAELTPPWSRWFQLTPGPSLEGEERKAVAGRLQDSEDRLQSHFERSNFAVEMHQCFLDLVTLGTACLLFEEAPLGSPSAFRFTAVPLTEAVLEEDAEGQLTATFRARALTPRQIVERFRNAELPPDLARDAAARTPEEQDTLQVVEAVVPRGGGFDYLAVLEADGEVGEGRVLARGRFARSPFLNFRWMKAPGEAYGRSPVMRALPDIKTANKVVELVLKNASIAATGIWQAEDDGVLNPATLRLVPGAIIPKAVGSSGLTPLQPAGNFDVSELVLADLRARIRQALLVDRLGPVNGPQMTATEVLERSAETLRLLGASYGRLQAELLNPLLARALAILARRGEVPEIALDGRLVTLRHRAPLAQIQAQQDVANTLAWVQGLAGFGPQALAVVEVEKAARWVGRMLGVPEDLIRVEAPPATGEALSAGDALSAKEAVLDPGL